MSFLAPQPRTVRAFVSHSSAVFADSSLSFHNGRTAQRADTAATTITLTPAAPREHAVISPNGVRGAERILSVRALRFTFEPVNIWSLAFDTDLTTQYGTGSVTPELEQAVEKSGARWSGFSQHVFSGVGPDPLQSRIADAYTQHVCNASNSAAPLRFYFTSNNTSSSGAWVVNQSAAAFSDVSGLTTGERFAKPTSGGGNTRLQASLHPDERRCAGFYLCLRGARAAASTFLVTGAAVQPLEAVAFFDAGQHDITLPSDFMSRGRYLWNPGNVDATSFVPADVPLQGAEFYLVSCRLAPFPAEFLGRWLAEVELVVQ